MNEDGTVPVIYATARPLGEKSLVVPYQDTHGDDGTPGRPIKMVILPGMDQKHALALFQILSVLEGHASVILGDRSLADDLIAILKPEAD